MVVGVHAWQHTDTNTSTALTDVEIGAQADAWAPCAFLHVPLVSHLHRLGSLLSSLTVWFPFFIHEVTGGVLFLLEGSVRSSVCVGEGMKRDGCRVLSVGYGSCYPGVLVWQLVVYRYPRLAQCFSLYLHSKFPITNKGAHKHTDGVLALHDVQIWKANKEKTTCISQVMTVGSW